MNNLISLRNLQARWCVACFLVVACLEFKIASAFLPVYGGRIVTPTRTMEHRWLHTKLSVGPTGDVFPNDGPYVPDGLTPEQYAEIKKKEAEKVAKMNFGAWGPRFRRSAAPDGDWFVNPRLWVSGFNTSPNVSSDAIHEGRPQKLGRWLRRYVPPFVLVWIWASMAMAVVLDFRYPHASAVQAIRRSFTAEFQRGLLATEARLKLGVFKVLISVLLSGPCAMYLEWMGRRRLWTPRRTYFVNLGISVTGTAAFVWLLRSILTRSL